MKYIRTYGDYNSWKTDYSNPDRGFRLKPTLYKYSDVGVESKILLENDDPRKHGDSTYMEITLDSDVEFSFYIGNKPGDTQTTMTCTIDWGDGVIEDKNITADDKGFKLSHNYKKNSCKIELYDVERDYSIIGDTRSHKSLISHLYSAKRVILGSGVTTIGVYAFSNCTSLTSINIPESVTSIEIGAFSSCKSLSSIYIPESVTSIGYSVFNYCTSLTSINIPESVTTIEDYTFDNCTSLKSINIPEGVTTIGVYAFHWCTSLTSINIPESVNSIGDSAFFGCYNLTSINIPESVTSIGYRMFCDCISLTSISSFNTTAPTLGDDVFTNLPKNGTLHIKPGATGYDAWLSKLPSGWRIVEDL